MVLNEAPSEKIQHTWYSRLAQERRELSASVEEALKSAPLEESFWLDDQSQHVAVVGTERIVGTEKSNNVFPPRLSLQSRSLPGTSSRVGAGLIDKHGSKRSNTHTSIWGRLTHRLTSLFMAFRFRPALGDSPALPSMAHPHVATQSAQVEEVINASGRSSDPSDSCVVSATTKKVGNKNECRVVTHTNARQGSLQSALAPQRLAGRITRIRLEVVPAPSVPTNKNSTSMRIPAIEKVTKRPVEDCTFADGDGGTTSLRLPALEKVTRRREELSPAWRAGTGMLECGQRDVTVSNPSVTASSVVLVMLTANPGPVVVQYVSLQPRKGFTVHLTAPTTIGVSFNYVVL